MSTRVIRRSLILTIGALLAACGSDEVAADKLDDVIAGMPKDSVLARLGPGPLTAAGADTVRVERGFRQMRYFINGTQYQVLYARELAGDVSEPVRQETETPIVFDQDGRVLGWGWRYYVEEAIAKLALPTPLVDTLPTAPVPPVPPAADSTARPDSTVPAKGGTA
jgi:hypothetical protein